MSFRTAVWRMVSQHIEKHRIVQALLRRVIPDRCINAYTNSLCVGEFLKCGGCRRLLPTRGICCLGVVVLALNFTCLYLLHTSPSPFMHAHGGVLPRKVGLGWDSNLLCRPLRFVDPPGELTALASVPGSGNTWLRHLLQQVTGWCLSTLASHSGCTTSVGPFTRRLFPIDASKPTHDLCPWGGPELRASIYIIHLHRHAAYSSSNSLHTGSMYNDALLKVSGFPGEGINNGSVLVVKTHDGHPDVRRHFRNAVLLIRRPQDAILAEFNRLHGGHLGHASQKDFEEQWTTFASDAADHWEVFNSEWLQFKGPLHIVRFEDLKENLNATLNSLLNFLNINVSSEDLDCALQHSDGVFRRQKKRRTVEMAKQYIYHDPLAQRFAESERRFQSVLNKHMHRQTISVDS